MKFEEIFKSEGLYRSDSFKNGIAFKIEANTITGELELYMVTYNNQNDVMPDKHTITVYANLFNKEYTLVLNRKQLFPNENKKF